MSEIATLIGSLVGVLTVVGAAFKWLWDKVQQRFEKIEAELEACREREKDATKREGVLLVHASKHLMVIELLWQEVERRSRGAPNAVLCRARELLDDLKEEVENV